MDKLKSESMDRLFRAILGLETLDDCYRFFSDICTVKEMQDISQRLDVALLLSDNIKYQDISARLGASTSTISRVNKCLMYGDGGYGAAIARLRGEGE